MKRELSPVVRSNVRFSGVSEFLHVNVWFSDRSELQKLIDALIDLRDSNGADFDHVHLQHYDYPASKQVGLAEVNFFRPGRGMTDLEKELTIQA
jgi:hypothetical protein